MGGREQQELDAINEEAVKNIEQLMDLMKEKEWTKLVEELLLFSDVEEPEVVKEVPTTTRGNRLKCSSVMYKSEEVQLAS